MTAPDRASLQEIASECVALVAIECNRQLDWSPNSLADLDDVCASLLADGALGDQRLDLWWRLIGAYTGEVLIQTYGGEWITHDRAPGAFAISVNGVTGFPFVIADRVLRGEPHKSLASFARALPAIADRAQHSTGS